MGVSTLFHRIGELLALPASRAVVFLLEMGTLVSHPFASIRPHLATLRVEA
jgi:hypothetical protein